LLLELGFGDGTPLGKRYIENGFDYLGIELSDKQIELAHKKMPSYKERFIFG
jgi:tRNA G46 methylase TrmB